MQKRSHQDSGVCKNSPTTKQDFWQHEFLLAKRLLCSLVPRSHVTLQQKNIKFGRSVSYSSFLNFPEH